MNKTSQHYCSQRAWRWDQLKHSFIEWRRRIRSRNELMNLGDGSLRDIGLNRGDAKGEASKPFWLA